MDVAGASTHLIAQFVGGFGFVLIFTSPLLRRRRSFLAFDIAGLVQVVIHYVLLGAPVGAALSALYIAMDLVSDLRLRHPAARRGYWLFYPMAAAATILGYRGLSDLSALAGAVLAVASRQQANFAALKFLVFCSAIGWGVYGYYAQSWSQVVFSTAYAGSALFGAAQEYRRLQTHG